MEARKPLTVEILHAEDKDKVEQARKDRDPHKRFRLQLQLKPHKWIDELKPPIAGLRVSCQNDRYAHGYGTLATLEALEQYTGDYIESVCITGVITSTFPRQ
ncbi:MAG: hypothetical protein K2Y22_14500 [Candidatus Obscuribacterales bacterium]|nr:hypothetical protein [Candidatus Obscuribacterales bacterium]